jgi:hypothetical protein
MTGADVSPKVLMKHAVHTFSEAISLWVVSRADTLLSPEDPPHFLNENTRSKTRVSVRDDVIRKAILGRDVEVEQLSTLFCRGSGIARDKDYVLRKPTHHY